jgi:translation initiation factor IF-1
MPSVKDSKSENKSDIMVRKFIDDIKKKDSDPNVYVGKVTKFLGNKRFEAMIDSDGIKIVQVAIPGKFSGRGRKGAMVSPGSFVLIAEDESIKMFEMLALIKREFVELINKLSPIHETIYKTSEDDKEKDDVFEREVAKDLEESEIDNI